MRAFLLEELEEITGTKASHLSIFKLDYVKSKKEISISDLFTFIGDALLFVYVYF